MTNERTASSPRPSPPEQEREPARRRSPFTEDERPHLPMKSLDAKLAEVKANSSSRAFILADAKDADMALGVRAPGPRSYLSGRGERPARFSPELWTRQEFGFRNLPEFLDIIREVTRQGLVD